MICNSEEILTVDTAIPAIINKMIPEDFINYLRFRIDSTNHYDVRNCGTFETFFNLICANCRIIHMHEKDSIHPKDEISIAKYLLAHLMRDSSLFETLWNYIEAQNKLTHFLGVMYRYIQDGRN